MTRSSRSLRCLGPRILGRNWRAGFSLVEVVIATGLCTYALVIIACLLPMGLGTIQNATSQIVQTEIFNRIWLEVNTLEFYQLPNYQRLKGGAFPDASLNSSGLTYFDKDGTELGGTTALNTTAAAGSAVYKVYCTLAVTSGGPYSTTLYPPIDGLGMTTNTIVAGSSGGAGLNLLKVQIGFHVDPSTATAGDSRVATRSFVIAKRDTVNGN